MLPLQAGWLCYHIDELLCPKYRLPAVHALQKLRVSELFHHAVYRHATAQQHAVEDSPATMHGAEDMVNVAGAAEEDNMDVVGAEEDVAMDVSGEEEEELDVDELICQCLLSATKMVTEGDSRTERKVERVHQLQELLHTQQQQGSMLMPRSLCTLSCLSHFSSKQSFSHCFHGNWWLSK